MDHAVFAEIKRAIKSKGFLISLGGMFIALMVSSVESFVTILQNQSPLAFGYHHQFLLQSLHTDIIIFILPILCALPATTSLIEDINSGMIKFYIPRSGKKAYIKGKLMACVLSGGGAPLLGTLLFYLTVTLVLLPMELALPPGETGPYYLHKLISAFGLVFLNGGLWSLCGMTLASLTMSRYMAYASPFICYYILIIFRERYFSNLIVIDPREWLFPQGSSVLGGFGVLILLLELMGILSMIFISCCQRRIENG